MPKGIPISDEQKKQISETLMGRKHTEERRRNQSNAKKGKKWTEAQRQSLAGIKHSEESKKRRSERMKGENNPNYGKPMSEEQKIKISITLTGKPGSKWTEEHKQKSSESQSGENSHWWKGGKEPLKGIIRSHYKYRQWRSDVYTRDDFTCQVCGQRGGKLNADHIKSFSQILHENNLTTIEEAIECSELWNINNGRTLCRACHHKTDTYAGNSRIKK
jgi:hypothetical protein